MKLTAILASVAIAGSAIGLTACSTGLKPTATAPSPASHTGQSAADAANLPQPTVTKTVQVPVNCKTQYVPASQGPTGTVIATYSGTGTEATGKFNVPASGDYVVKWSYSSNTDPSIGGGSNFSITPISSSGMSGNYPNDIAKSGSGSTEDTGMSGGQAFNVMATGYWKVTVISAD